MGHGRRAGGRRGSPGPAWAVPYLPILHICCICPRCFSSFHLRSSVAARRASLETCRTAGAGRWQKGPRKEICGICSWGDPTLTHPQLGCAPTKVSGGLLGTAMGDRDQGSKPWPPTFVGTAVQPLWLGAAAKPCWGKQGRCWKWPCQLPCPCSCWFCRNSPHGLGWGSAASSPCPDAWNPQEASVPSPDPPPPMPPCLCSAVKSVLWPHWGPGCSGQRGA